ncbi:prolyl oligopeptidase family serine peptidase [Haloarcula amylovorans]|uniref:prolyl oligopeptidase family serine peptidase n=1 Tax=Haloarcula amylovorans TaxID=2562280 RepID=UPI001075E80F|nr:prolyl oligopeptidase family serine peptidase [Halomicroarcula amylolytica]
MQRPPSTDRDPVTDTLHGTTITDPYRWLEADDDAVAEWENAQNAYTDDIVATPQRDSLHTRLSAVADHASYQVPVAAGGRYFQRIEAADADQPRLTVRKNCDDDPRTLVDPAALGETTALQWFVPSSDGECVVYGLTEAGTEQYDLRVCRASDGTVVDEIADVGRCGDMMVAWKDSGFYHLRTGSADEGGQLEKALWFHEVGGESWEVTDDIPTTHWPWVYVERETGVTVVAMGELGADVNLYALVDSELAPVLTDGDATFHPLVHDGRVYLRTNHDAPRFRVLAIDAADFADADGLSDFETVVPESEDVVADIAPAGDGLGVHRLRNASSVVSVHDGDGRERYELDFPKYAGIPRDSFSGSRNTAELLFALEGFDRPTSVIHADVGTDAGPDDWQVQQSPDLPDNLDPHGELDLTTDRLWVESADGTSVPVYVVHRSDVDPEDAPTVLYGYGGFRIPLLPNLDPYRLPFLADGGVFALACLRGGLEFGEAWHEAGSCDRKENTFADFEAAAEALVDRGYTTSERLAAWGGSNGGLTVGAALTRRPELFGAVVCTVPLLDMLRFHQLLLGEAWTGEYGSPEDAAAFDRLRSYSPYHSVAAVEYPATLFVTAAGDTRVHPAHARKMTARVQAKTTGDAPICYRSYDESGHGVGTPTSLEVTQELDKWAFVYRTLNVAAD